mgnify:CR=1 FL=1
MITTISVRGRNVDVKHFEDSIRILMNLFKYSIEIERVQIYYLPFIFSLHHRHMTKLHMRIACNNTRIWIITELL